MSETTLLPEIRINGFKEVWKAYELNDLCSLITKQTGFDYSATIKPSLLRDGNENTYSFIQNKDFLGTKINLNTDFYIPKKIAETFPNILLDRPSILISISGKIGNAGLYTLPQKAFIGGAVGICKLTDEANGLVTLYNLLGVVGQRYFQTLIKASSHSNITVEDIRKIKIYLPSSNEEKNSIGTYFSGMDELISLNKAKLEKLSNLKKAMLEKMFPKQGADVPEIRFKGFAGVWEKKRFGDCVLIQRGGSPRPIENFITNDENGINWIKIGDVSTTSRYITKTKEKIIPSGEKHSRRVYAGDLILSNSMSFGRPYIMAIEGCIHDGWLVIRDENKLFKLEYLLQLLSSDFMLKQYKALASGGVVINLNSELVQSTTVYIPTLDEQEKIGTYFQSLDKNIALHQTELDKLNNLKKACLEKMFV